MSTTAEIISLSATIRERVGTREAKKQRAAGRLPAVVYGHGKEAVSLTLESKTATRAMLEGHKLFDLKIEGGSTETVLLKDMQYDYLGRELLHVDVERVDLDEKVTINVRLRYRGDAPGMKVGGAIMLHPVTELAVRCRVRDIIDQFDIDLSELGPNESMYAESATLPDGFELVSEGKSVIAAIEVKTKGSKDQDEEGEEASDKA